MSEDSKADAGADEARVEGEGSYTGARRYDENVRQFVKSGRVEEAARDAEAALDGPGADELRKAEAEGRKHSHGEDPKLSQKIQIDEG